MSEPLKEIITNLSFLNDKLITIMTELNRMKELMVFTPEIIDLNKTKSYLELRVKEIKSHLDIFIAHLND